MTYLIHSLVLLWSFSLIAKPYPHPEQVTFPEIQPAELVTYKLKSYSSKTPVLRVEINWHENETYSLAGSYVEQSGTEALVRSSRRKDVLGSFKAELEIENGKEKIILHSSIGTGREFRRLVRTLSFRFPLIEGKNYKIRLIAEHPETGAMEKVLEKELYPENFEPVPAQTVKVTLLKPAKKFPPVKLNFYAEGFKADGEQKFLAAAKKAIAGLDQNVPGAADYFEYRAVFAPSNQKIGPAQDLGSTVKVRDSFLGLYFPHWRKFGRWYHVVYPTSETKYRNSLAQEPYDYPLALVDDNAYWGVGNYKELTAIPVGSSQFTYLLLHEFGHFMGLNEEYEGGGPTELEFAPKISEPWSQNITFNVQTLKWKDKTEPGISLPTSTSDYYRYGGSLKNPVGAYKGGYADSEPQGRSHKPVMKCMMGSGGDFCKICQDALLTLIQTDSGE